MLCRYLIILISINGSYFFLLEYNLNSLRRGFGQLNDIQYETVKLGKPSLVIHSSTLEKNENDIVTFTNYVLNELAKTELRKRFAIVHTEKYIYIVGGYIYDPQIPIRRKALHDYKYDIQTSKLIPTQALPNGAICFGLCCDENYIYAIGGNTLDNKVLTDCYCLTLKNSNETWIKLPDLPAPTSGPGVGVHNNILHCIGGYDILGNKSIAHGEYLTLRYPQDKQWRYVSQIDTVRALPLVFIIPGNSINEQNVYVAGGFNVNSHTHKTYIVPDLQVFNQMTQRWQRVTTIPDLELSHALSFNNDKLHISEIIELPNELPMTNILRSFDLQKLIWTNGKDNNDNKRIKIPEKPLQSSSNLSSDVKKIPNILAKTKISTLKFATFF
ncbi:unnamed protein product [Adineta steineri]|uniref:Uncharacterized protein n=1 Tax=Adineta steineri TaxID=433720 RepID=A0A814ANV1_9BILA|nr:unnamed protein product [Adineta steineri]